MKHPPGLLFTPVDLAFALFSHFLSRDPLTYATVAKGDLGKPDPAHEYASMSDCDHTYIHKG
jgi:hypothetical protein